MSIDRWRLLRHDGVSGHLAALKDRLAALSSFETAEVERVTRELITERHLQSKDLIHPARVALTGRAEGPELDLAVPAIDRGADLPADAGLPKILGCRERAAAFVAELER